MFADFGYFSTLAFSISLGSYYKEIDNVEVKKHYGTGVGFLITLLINGHYLYHTIVMVWLNSVILKCCNRRYVHLVSLACTWMHLFYLHFNLSHAKYVVIVHQNIALRLVGIAFEIYEAEREKESPTPNKKADLDLFTNITVADIVSYTFCYIGLHKGPYYRYKMYVEHLRRPYGSMGNFRQITEHKLKKVFLCLILYVLLRMNFSTEIYNDKAFYNFDAETRYLYNVPLLAMFVLKNVIIMLLCSCVCTEAGFGVFPAKTVPIAGHGPSVQLSLLNLSQAEAMEQEYNFAMIQSYHRDKILMGPKMTDTIRSWDMTTRYWFWCYLRNNIITGNKDIRSALASFLWSMWAGSSLQSMIICSTLWVYRHIESEYSELYNTGGQMKMAWNIGFSIMRLFCLIYLTPCFVVLNASAVLRYYNSIFWAFHILLLVLIAGAIVIRKNKL